MRAIRVERFGGPEELSYVDIPPYSPGPHQVTVRRRAAEVNPADTYIRTGTYAFYRPTLPYTPAFDGAGEIEQVGAGLSGFEPGDQVFVSWLGSEQLTGTYADKCWLRRRRSIAYRGASHTVREPLLGSRVRQRGARCSRKPTSSPASGRLSTERRARSACTRRNSVGCRGACRRHR